MFPTATRALADRRSAPAGQRAIGPDSRAAARLDRQPLAALGPAGVDRPATGARRHPRPEAMPSFALQVTGLERPFHVMLTPLERGAILLRAPVGVNADDLRPQGLELSRYPQAGRQRQLFRKYLLLLVGWVKNCAQLALGHACQGPSSRTKLLTSHGVACGFSGGERQS